MAIARAAEALELAEGGPRVPMAVGTISGGIPDMTELVAGDDTLRGRIGLVTPSTNTTLEPELNRMAPPGVTIHAARVLQSGGQQQESYERMAADIETASRHLATAEVDVIAFGCTSCTYFVDSEKIREVMSRETLAPAVLTADAVVEALRAVGAWRVALAGPRTEFVTRREVEFLEAQGFEVVSWRCLGLGATDASRRSIGRVPAQTVRELVKATDVPQADAVFISCTQLRTASLIEEIEQAIGKPLITSNQATLWQCLQACGLKDSIEGFGQLLRNIESRAETIS